MMLAPIAWSQSRITLEDLVSIESPGAPVLSPDGMTFAMTRGGQIVLAPAEGGWPVTLTTTQGGKSSLDWSPDGRMITYISGGNVWVVSASGGAPRQLTNAPPGSGDPRQATDRSPQYSPKGKWILFETGRRGNADIMAVSEDGVTTSYLTMTSGDDGNAAWSPDGTKVAYVERTREHFSGVIKVLGFDPNSGRAAGAPQELYTAPTDRGGGWAVGRPVWSPDGKSLAVVLQESGWDHIYLIPVTGGAPRAVTSGEFDDANPVFSPDGKLLAITSSRDILEERHIWIVPLDGTAPRRLAQSTVPCMESNPQWSPDGTRIYFHRSTPLEPQNLFVIASTGGTPKALTNTLPLNFARADFRMPEKIQWKSKDGITISGILHKPRDFKTGTRYPTVLWIHGGPEGQDGFNFDTWAMYLTQEGYVVLRPNYRGSNGYGEKFRNLNVEDSGGGEMDDVATGAQYLIAQGIADPKRIAIGGGSHGGTMTAYAVVKYPDLFAAAIELFGVVNRATFNERTNRPSAIRWAMKMGGAPDEKPEVYRKANVLLQIDRVRTPLLVMHGEDDPQVPPYESAQFVRALKDAGKTVFYFTYPNELHGFSQRDHRLDAWRKQLSFLARYLQPRYGTSSTSVEDFPGSGPASTPVPPAAPPPRRP